MIGRVWSNGFRVGKNGLLWGRVLPRYFHEEEAHGPARDACMLAFRNRIEVIPVRDVRSLRGYLKGIDTPLRSETEIR